MALVHQLKEKKERKKYRHLQKPNLANETIGYNNGICTYSSKIKININKRVLARYKNCYGA